MPLGTRLVRWGYMTASISFTSREEGLDALRETLGNVPSLHQLVMLRHHVAKLLEADLDAHGDAPEHLARLVLDAAGADARFALVGNPPREVLIRLPADYLDPDRCREAIVGMAEQLERVDALVGGAVEVTRGVRPDIPSRDVATVFGSFIQTEVMKALEPTRWRHLTVRVEVAVEEPAAA